MPFSPFKPHTTTSTSATHILQPITNSTTYSPWRTPSPTTTLYSSFRTFIFTENQLRATRGEQPLCTPSGCDKAFQKLLRLSKGEEKIEWEIDEGLWGEEIEGEFGWYAGFVDGGGEGLNGEVEKGVGGGCGMGYEEGLMEREEREMRRGDREEDLLFGERLVDEMGMRKGKGDGHQRKDSKEVYHGGCEDGR